MPRTMSRVKVCYKCKEYIRLFDDNPISQHFEILFKKHHAGHPIQVVNEQEFKDLKAQGYKNFSELFGGV